MSLSKHRSLLLVLAGLVGIFCFGFVAYAAPQFFKERTVAACEKAGSEDNQVECVFRILEAEMRTDGLGAAMDTFAQAYELLPAFTAAGCHPKAHRVGDVAYFSLYVGTEDLDAIDFTQTTSACSFGFYHGFFEHLIQDNPQADFIDKTCDYFEQRLGSTMDDMVDICYHGAGHGLLLAQAERVTQSDWGNLKVFSEAPAAICNALPAASASDKERCRTGIFNVLVEFRGSNQYGFSYDAEYPFAICDTLPSHLQRECIFEMTRKLDSASGYDVGKLQSLANQAPTQELREHAFLVGIGGYVQNIECSTNTYTCVLHECRALSNDFFSLCLKGVVRGVYERGSPQKEYQEVLQVCSGPAVRTRGAESACYKLASFSLTRFYTPEKIARICKEFPEEYRSFCESKLES